MGARGPQRKPAALRLVGTAAQMAAKLADEPQPARVMPTLPPELDEDGIRAWEYFAPKLFELGLLTEADGHTLALYCAAYSDWVWAVADIKTNGRVHIADTGYEQMRQAVAIKRQSVETMLKVGAQFGLSPSSRAGLKVGKMGIPKGEFSDI